MKELIVFGGALVARAPLLVVAIIGLWLALSRRGRHQRVSLWAAAGSMSLIAYVLFGAGVQIYLALLTEPPADASTFAERLAIANGLGYALLVVGIAFLQRAVFIDRA